MARTKQEIFDLAFNGIKSQGWERSTSGRNCRYRGENNRRCAIGWLIDDVDYHLIVESLTPTSAYLRRITKIPKILTRFALELQLSHDGAQSAKHMKERLLSFARQYKLRVPNKEDKDNV